MKTEILGLRIIEEQDLKCGDCNTTLIKIVLAETNSDRIARGERSSSSKYRVFDCPKCGGSTFYSKTFKGTTAISPGRDSFSLSVENTDQDPDGTIVTKLKAVRN